MKKFATVCLCFVISSVVFLPQESSYSKASKEPRRLYADDKIIVKLKEGVSDFVLPEEIRGARETGGLKINAVGREGRGRLETFRIKQGVSVEDAIRRVQSDPRVEYAEPDYFFYASDTVPNDPFFQELWGLSPLGCTLCPGGQSAGSINASRAWDFTVGSDDLVVGVIDTGADLKHPDLAANAWVNPFEIDGNGVDDDGNGFVDDINGWNFFDETNEVFKSATQDRHGTHVAGTIGAEGNNGIGVTGVAWQVKIMSLKFLGGEKGSGSTSGAVKAINYAIDMKKRGVNIRVLNASWSGEGASTTLRNAITAAGEAGILFVAAAGNDGENADETPHYPGNFSSELPNTIGVAAINASSELSSFSNYGHNNVSVAAPGQSILSTVPGDGYAIFSGTSMAAPVVSGIAALLFSHEPNLTPAEAKQRIVSTSEPTDAVVSRIATSGRADAYRALTNTIAEPVPPRIVKIEVRKKLITIDGFGFANGASVIEVNGVPLSGIEYDSSYSLANGTLTRLTARPGKKAIKKAFPLGQLQSVTIYNQVTGERSTQFMSARF